jgi:nicotinamide phosphoribosyltransferase
MNIFPLHATDFYKTGHYAQYPKGTEYVYSNWTCRSDKFFRSSEVFDNFDHKVVFFGLQYVCKYLLQELWNKNFFEKPLEEVVAKYQRRMDTALGVGMVSMTHIRELHDLGYLPILIKALPEGSRVDIRVPCFTITNTVKGFGWLTNYLETAISAELWHMITTATTAYEYRRLLDKYADVTGADKNFVPWQGHDFSARGMLGLSGGAASGAAHLLSFTGTDTILALDFLEEYYQGKDTFLGGSVPATEHSVMCMGGADDEVETFRRLIEDVYPSDVVSIVSDTWDFWHVITQTSFVLKESIMSRAGKVVFRPDSGDPVNIICGDLHAPQGTPEYKGAVECLWDIFRGTVTEKGYKVLDSHVGLIYGDSITLERAEEILKRLKDKGFASSNIVFGVGSFTYQHVTRDTLGQAIKATHGQVNGEPRDLFKKPKTDSGLKNSLCGLIRIEREHGHFVAYDKQKPYQEQQGLLTTVFENGSIVKDDGIADIRKRLLEG